MARALSRATTTAADGCLTEEALARAWEERDYSSATPLRTVEGTVVRVVHPGRRNTDQGPDFLDALLVFGEGPLRRGDAELHLDSSDWFAHGHAGDAAYAGVILHVVAHASRRHTTLDGAPVLELPLTGDEEARPRGYAPLEHPMVWAAHATGEPEGHAPRMYSSGRPTEALLEELGKARLEARAAALEGDVAAVGVEQALYEALLAALGYSKNAAPFRELARRVPFGLLRETAQGAPSECERATRIAGLLFGAAGLLPSQRGNRPRDGYTRRVEEVWGWLGGMAPLPAGSWRTFRVRPENHPLRRVGAASALAAGWLRDDLVGRLRRAVVGGATPRRCVEAVVAVLVIGSEGYWACHRDFGTPRRGGPAALIGRSRAYEMTASVALPFLLALGDWVEDRGLEDSARAAYGALPSPPENALARWAEAHFMGAREDRGGGTGRRQQGLLHLAKTRL